MVTLRRFLPSLCLVGCLSGSAVYAAAAAPPAAEPGPDGDHHGHFGHHGHHGGPLGEFGFLLHKLKLTEGQWAEVKTILASEKAQFQTLGASVKANRTALATTPPNASGYQALVQAAETNAGTRITLQSVAWTQIYENVLTSTQQGDIPGIVAAAQAAREARVAAWKAQHPQS